MTPQKEDTWYTDGNQKYMQDLGFIQEWNEAIDFYHNAIKKTKYYEEHYRWGVDTDQMTDEEHLAHLHVIYYDYSEFGDSLRDIKWKWFLKYYQDMKGSRLGLDKHQQAYHYSLLVREKFPKVLPDSDELPL
jgi:hypothetical protein